MAAPIAPMPGRPVAPPTTPPEGAEVAVAERLEPAPERARLADEIVQRAERLIDLALHRSLHGRYGGHRLRLRDLRRLRDRERDEGFEWVANLLVLRGAAGWQWTADRGRDLARRPVSMQATTLVAGLTPGRTHWFRIRVSNEGGGGGTGVRRWRSS